MKLAPKTLTPTVRAEIGDAIASLEKAIKRAARDGADALKLSNQMEALEDEHAELSGKRTLSREDATSETAIIAQKARLARVIEETEGTFEKDRRAVVHILDAVQPLVFRLLGLATKQVRAEVQGVMAPYFRAEGLLAQVSGTTELEQNLVAHFRRAVQGANFTLAEAVSSAEATKTILADIAADRDFYSLPVAVKAA